MIGRESSVLVGRSLHNPLHLFFFHEIWEFLSALEIVSAKMRTLLLGAASGAQAAATELPALTKLGIIQC